MPRYVFLHRPFPPDARLSEAGWNAHLSSAAIIGGVNIPYQPPSGGISSHPAKGKEKKELLRHELFQIILLDLVTHLTTAAAKVTFATVRNSLVEAAIQQSNMEEPSSSYANNICHHSPERIAINYYLLCRNIHSRDRIYYSI